MVPPPLILYYIDYNVQNKSKTIGVSKKKITFKFGFANKKAIDDGLVGAHCRGSEHEVVFTWSLNSGKRHVTLDGKDVHFSSSGQNGWTSDRTWQHVFNLKVPSHSGTFRCHLISQPAPQGTNIRPFDLRVGGISIFKFNQIFQLGTPQMTVRRPAGNRNTYLGGSGGGGSPDEEAMSPEERRMLAVARVESMKEYRKQQERESSTKSAVSAPAQLTNGAPPAAAASGGGDLLSFDALPAAAPPVPAGQPVQTGAMVSSLTMPEFQSGGSYPGSPAAAQGQPPFGYPQQQPNQQPPPNYGQQPPQQQQYGQYGYGNQPSSNASFAASSATSPTANTTALTPYQSPPGQAQAPAGYSLRSSFTTVSGGTAPTQASTQAPMAASMDPYAKPPADPWASPAPAPPPQQQQYGGYQVQSPANSTQASMGTYGSAPSFARPPETPQQQPPAAAAPAYQQQPAYQQPPAYAQQNFGPPSVGHNPYASPAYQQPQQYQQPGF